MKQEKNIWEQSRVELFQKLDCRETGLSQEDAALRLLKYGANELHAGKQKSVWQIFLGQFADFLVLICRQEQVTYHLRYSSHFRSTVS